MICLTNCEESNDRLHQHCEEKKIIFQSIPASSICMLWHIYLVLKHGFTYGFVFQLFVFGVIDTWYSNKFCCDIEKNTALINFITLIVSVVVIMFNWLIGVPFRKFHLTISILNILYMSYKRLLCLQMNKNNTISQQFEGNQFDIFVHPIRYIRYQFLHHYVLFHTNFNFISL